MTTTHIKICLFRHGVRQDRSQESGITKESYSRLQGIGKALLDDYKEVHVFYGPRKRAVESAKAIVDGMKRVNKNIKIELNESPEIDEFDVDEQYKVDKEGNRVPGAKMFNMMLKGIEVSSKESIKHYINRIKRFNKKLLEKFKGSKEDILVIIIHHDFGLDFILKDILADKGIKYKLNGNTRFKREEFFELIYKRDKGLVLSQINLPTRHQVFDFGGGNPR